MLNQDELNNLFNIISDESKTFEQVGQQFNKTFLKQDQFKVGITIWYLLKDNLLNSNQRIASFYIFYDMFKMESTSNTPFIPIILETLETTTSNAEKKFLLEFIQIGTIKNSKISIKNFLEENKYIEFVPVPDLKQYWQLYEIEKEKFPTLGGDWIRPVIYENDEGSTSKINKDNQPPFNFTNLSKEELSFNHFEPNYMTFYPNSSYQFFEDEPIWITPGLNFDFLWDFTLNQEQNVIKSLLNRVLNGKSISEEQEKNICDMIQENNRIIVEINFTPESLYKLIENNSKLAAEIYIRLAKAEFFKEYLEVFLKKPYTIYSLEVINKIIQYIELPNTFIDRFICNLITLKTEKNKTRNSRIAAIFIGNLIENEHINFEGALPQYLQDFLNENSKEKDVEGLITKINARKKVQEKIEKEKQDRLDREKQG